MHKIMVSGKEWDKVLDILNLNGWLIAVMVVVSMALYKLVGSVTVNLLRRRGVTSGNQLQLISMIVAVVFNIVLLSFFGFNVLDMVQLVELELGIFWTVVGVIFSCLMSYLTYQVIRSGQQGQKYAEQFGEASKRDRFYIFTSFLVVVGPAEDLFFLGLILTTLLAKAGSWAIPFYLVIFTFYHYTNVLQGIESKREFFNMLPFRFVIAAILATTYSRTGTLLYSMIIHNLFDTINYMGLLAGVKARATVDPRSIRR